MIFRIGTRGSPLALSQTEEIRRRLETLHPELRPEFQIDVTVVKTTGDKMLDAAFPEIGSKGVFTKELDEALAAGKIDCAVHSLKDLPSDLAAGTALTAVTVCLDPRDALVSKSGDALKDLPEGSRIGTSSLRRSALLRNRRPDLRIEQLRGNVDTRLRKLDEGKCDAVVLAAAGLKRLGFERRISEYLDPYDFIPAVGQGLLGIVCRAGDGAAEKTLAGLDDAASHRMADAQRVFMAKLEGGCKIPLGCYGEEKNGKVRLAGFLSTADGLREIREEIEGPAEKRMKLAEDLAVRILGAGGREILDSLRAGAKA